MKYLTLLFFLFTHLTYSTPPIEEMYAFLDFYTLNYHQCPVRGMIAVESSWIKNLLLTGDQNHNTVKLGKTLLHLLEISEELTATTYDPYSRFGFKTIAALIYALETNTIAERKDNQWTILDKIKKSFAGKKNPAQLNELIKTIINAKEEEKAGIYPGYTTEQTLLTFLYLKAPKTRALRDFTKELRKLKNEKSLVESSRQKAWTIEEFDEFRSWCNDPQEPGNQKIPPKFLDLEMLLAALSHENQSYDLIPPRIYYQYLKKDGNEIADCCESVLEYFCTILLYDPSSKKLDLSLISPTIEQAMPTTIKEFLENAKTENIKLINAFEQRSLWYKLISNNDEIEYRRTTDEGYSYEIHPSASNLIGSIRYIFGLSKDENEIFSKEALINSWNNLCDEISNKSFPKISCVKTWFTSNIRNSTTFKLVRHKNQSKTPLIFTFHIQPEHSWITIDNMQNFNLFKICDGEKQKNNRNLLIKQLMSEYKKVPTIQTKDIVHLCAPYLDVKKLPHESLYNLTVLAHPTENDLQKLRYCKRLLSIIDTTQSAYLPLLFKQINTFHNEYFKRKVICSVIRKNLINNEISRKEISKISKDLTEREQYQPLLALMQKKAWNYKGYGKLLEKLFDNIPEFEIDEVFHSFELENKSNLEIDTKVTILNQTLIWQGYQNNILRQKFMNIFQSLPKERATKLYRLSQAGPFSSYNDEQSHQMRMLIKSEVKKLFDYS